MNKSRRGQTKRKKSQRQSSNKASKISPDTRSPRSSKNVAVRRSRRTRQSVQSQIRSRGDSHSRTPLRAMAPNQSHASQASTQAPSPAQSRGPIQTHSHGDYRHGRSGVKSESVNIGIKREHPSQKLQEIPQGKQEQQHPLKKMKQEEKEEYIHVDLPWDTPDTPFPAGFLPKPLVPAYKERSQSDNNDINISSTVPWELSEDATKFDSKAEESKEFSLQQIERFKRKVQLFCIDISLAALNGYDNKAKDDVREGGIIKAFTNFKESHGITDERISKYFNNYLLRTLCHKLLPSEGMAEPPIASSRLYVYSIQSCAGPVDKGFLFKPTEVIQVFAQSLHFKPKQSCIYLSCWKAACSVLLRFIVLQSRYGEIERRFLACLWQHFLKVLRDIPHQLPRPMYEKCKAIVKILERCLDSNITEFVLHSLYNEKASISDYHWTLRKMLSNIFKSIAHRKSVSAPAAPSRLVGAYVLSSRKQLLEERTQEIQPNSRQENRPVWVNAQLLEDRAPLSFLECFAKDGKTADPQMKSHLVNALAFRLLKLVNNVRKHFRAESSRTDTTGEKKAVEESVASWEQYWGEFLIFADQFAALVTNENQFVDLMAFLKSCISYSQRHSMRFQDNSILWVLLQILPHQTVWQTVTAHIRSTKGQFLNQLIRIAYKDQRPKHMIRDQSLRILTNAYFRKYSRAPDKPPCEDWWQSIKDRSDVVALYRFSVNEIASMAVVSLYLPSEVANYIISFLSYLPQQYHYLPGQIPFHGRARPLGTPFLAHLSVPCKQRIAEKLSREFFQQTNQLALAPGIVETYARLLYLSPYSLAIYVGEINVMLTSDAPEAVVHTYLEIGNYRFFTLYRNCDVLREIYPKLCRIASKTVNGQLYKSVENFLMKIVIGTQHFLEMQPKQKLGVAVSRSLIIGLARLLKQRHSAHRKYQNITDEQVMTLLKIFREFNGQRVWSKQTLKYFPQILQQQITTFLGTTGTYSTWDQAVQLAKINCIAGIATVRPELEKVKEYLRQNQGKQWLLFGAVAVLWTTNQSNLTTAVLCSLANQISPRVRTACIYTLIDCIIDHLQGGGQTSPRISSEQFGDMFSAFIWDFKIVPFEICLMALLDRDDSLHCFPLIKYLLFDRKFCVRKTQIAGLHTEGGHWKYPQGSYIKECQYQEAYEDIPGFAASDLVGPLPIYFSNTMLKVIPVLDILLGRLIEHNMGDLFEKIVEHCWPLYNAFHETPVTYVKNTFCYYDGSEMLKKQKIKKLLLKLCVHETRKEQYRFTDETISYRGKADSQDEEIGGYFYDGPTRHDDDDEQKANFSSHKYMHKLLTKIGHYLPKPTFACRLEEHCSNFFHEFPNVFENYLFCAIVELCCCPLSMRECCEALLIAAYKKPIHPNETSFWNTSVAVAILISQLPRTYEREFIRCIRDAILSFPFIRYVDGLGHEEELRYHSGASLPRTLYDLDYDSVSASRQYLSTPVSKLGSITKDVFQFCGKTAFSDFVMLMCEEPKRKIEHSWMQLEFFTRILSPFVSHYNNPNIIDKIVYFFLRYLINISQDFGITKQTPQSHFSFFRLDKSFQFLIYISRTFPISKKLREQATKLKFQLHPAWHGLLEIVSTQRQTTSSVSGGDCLSSQSSTTPKFGPTR